MGRSYKIQLPFFTLLYRDGEDLINYLCDIHHSLPNSKHTFITGIKRNRTQETTLGDTSWITEMYVVTTYAKHHVKVGAHHFPAVAPETGYSFTSTETENNP